VTTPAKDAGAAPSKDAVAPPAKGAETTPAKDAVAPPAQGAETAPAKDAVAPPAQGAVTATAKDAATAPAQSNETAPATDVAASPAKDADTAPATDLSVAPVKDKEPAQDTAAIPAKDTGAATAPAAEKAGPKDAELAAQPKCDTGHFLIVLDVGHSATKSGVPSARGVPEFRFNKNLAEIVLKHLRDAGFTRTQLKIQDQADLYARARDLDSSRPDLILSLHHDGVQAKYVKLGQTDGAGREYTDDRFIGYSLFVSYDNPQRESSVRFARLLGEELVTRNHKVTMHHAEQIAGENRPVIDARIGVFRYDHLVVLRSVNAPSVLMESAVIVNPNDELNALNPVFQAEIGDSVVDAARNYCAAAAPVPMAAKRPVPASAREKSDSALASKAPSRRHDRK
jgi:N-acetylmuramoyl-L-alanine amidase